MPTTNYNVTCTQNKKLCHDIYEIKFRLPEEEKIEFKAGQFVLWDVPLVDDPDDIQPRAYSIASPPCEDTELTFVFGFHEGGRAGRFVSESLKEGDTVRMQGPFGNFTVNTETSKGYVFIATGCGVAPFRSQLMWLLEELKDARPMHLFFGVRHEEDLFWVDEFNGLAKRFPNLHVHISLSKPDDSWKGLKGRVTNTLPEIITDFSSISTYTCGGPDMVKSVKEFLLGKGVPKEDVHGEGYI
jgi:NAD(P)H-flavin reductase